MAVYVEGEGWLARTIKVDQPTLSALCHANLRSEMTLCLGVGWYPPEHGIAEIADFDADVLAEFSQRRGETLSRVSDLDQPPGSRLVG